MIHDLYATLKSFHDPATFTSWLSTGGIWVVNAVVFAETGLLFGFFLPGDSLLITAGVLSNPANPNSIMGLSTLNLNLTLVIAAFLGDQLGYYLGRKSGDTIFNRPDGRFFKRKYVVEAHAFYERHGILAIMACKFIPIFRTFVPFVAGVATMKYSKYIFWDFVGSFVWITSLLWLGHFLGQTEMANRLDKLILIVIFVSILPMLIGVLKRIFQKNTIEASK